MPEHADKTAFNRRRTAATQNWIAALTGELTASSLQVWVRTLLVMMVFLLFWRALYRFVYPSYFAAVPGKDLWMVYLVGLRFDLATALGTIAAPMLLLWLPWPRVWRRWVNRVSLWLTCAFVIVSVGFMWGDLLFFEENGHHLTSEPADTTHAVWPMVNTAFTEYPLQLIGLCLLCWGFVWAIRKQFRHASDAPTRWWGYPLRLVLVAAVTLIGVRGGLQKEPLKVTDAIISQYYTAANLALNGWYSFTATMIADHRDRPLAVPDDKAVALTQKIIAGPRDHFESPRYPLLRRTYPTASIAGKDAQLNVVLIIVESLNATYLPSFGGPLPVMPFLDSLAHQSLIFTNCNSVATRSFRGVCACLTSVPDLGDDALGITFALPKLRGLGEILHDQNYHVSFLHGASPGSMGIEAIAHMAGYEHFESSADFPSSAQNGSWGVWDHLALERISEELDTTPEPYHYGMFTLCTHAPWKLPDGFKPSFAPTVPNAEILNSFAYLDASFRDFFARESQKDRFKRTLYVIIGDHTSHALSEQELYRIANIYYAPGRIAPAVDTRLTSQLDVLPTILDLAGVDAPHAAFGRSAVDADTASRYNVSVQGSLLHWRRPDRTLVNDLRKDITLYDPQDPRDGEANLLQTEPLMADSLRRELHAFYQTANSLIHSNRISPPK
ncbi:MAG TPA: sulfatase-like hydrolase/transferase [bacterium]